MPPRSSRRPPRSAADFVLVGESRRGSSLGCWSPPCSAAASSPSAPPPGLFTQSRLVTAIGIPNLVGLALGQGGETGLSPRRVQSARRPRRRDLHTSGRTADPRAGSAPCGVALLVFVVSLSWAAPWYVLWILPFAALSGSRAAARRRARRSRAYFILAFMPSRRAAHLRARLPTRGHSRSESGTPCGSTASSASAPRRDARRR